MKIIRKFVQFAASPVLLALAALLYANPSLDHGRIGALHSRMAMTGAEMGQPPMHAVGVALPDGLASTLPSMALMYALMGLFHLSPWLGLFERDRGNAP